MSREPTESRLQFILCVSRDILLTIQSYFTCSAFCKHIPGQAGASTEGVSCLYYSHIFVSLKCSKDSTCCTRDVKITRSCNWLSVFTEHGYKIDGWLPRWENTVPWPLGEWKWRISFRVSWLRAVWQHQLKMGRSLSLVTHDWVSLSSIRTVLLNRMLSIICAVY